MNAAYFSVPLRRGCVFISITAWEPGGQGEGGGQTKHKPVREEPPSPRFLGSGLPLPVIRASQSWRDLGDPSPTLLCYTEMAQREAMSQIHAEETHEPVPRLLALR